MKRRTLIPLANDGNGMAGDEKTSHLALFCGRRVEGGAADVARLGHKGAHLAQMMRLKLPVPPGFVLPVDIWREWRETGALPRFLKEEIRAALTLLEEETGLAFGGARPLLLAVRATTRRAAPGTLPSVLNVGLSAPMTRKMAQDDGDAAFAWDCRCRLLRDFGVAVAGMPHELFEEVEEEVRHADMAREEASERLAEAYLALLEEELGAPFPEDPHAQLLHVVEALLRSWDAPPASAWRAMHEAPREWGVAIVVQAMVFGNRDADSAAGVATTRDPQSGEKRLSGEYLPRAQGVDIVAGLRTPLPLTEEMRRALGLDTRTLQETQPRAFAELQRCAAVLERHYRFVQNIEFVIESGRLWLVQTANARLAAEALVRVVVDMAQEGLMTRRQALLRVDPARVEQLLHPVLETRAGAHVLAHGLAASPGAASGEVVIDAQEAQRLALRGRPVILVRYETTPEDIPGLQAARGVITARGGMTSHAAVIARGLGIACVSAVAGLRIDESAGEVRIGHDRLRVGEWITLDGAAGEIYRGRLPTRQPRLSRAFRTLLEWADEVRPLAVRANADTARDARIARAFGARGIGLCRTEHMFFGSSNITHVRRLILARDDKSRREALEAMLPMQRADFLEIFRIMHGQPVTIRLLDPPAHEFLPRTEAEMRDVAALLGEPLERVRVRVQAMRETNPMLGRRGARLALTLEGLVEMQARAMMEAMIAAAQTNEAPARLEILVPFVMTAAEMRAVRARIENEMARLARAHDSLPPWRVGCMMELPSACLLADEIAAHADFFSFGTNDLTQTVLGLSRDDAGSFLKDYLREELLAHDPFVTLDTRGVGGFIRMAVARGRRERADLALGACGEHAGDARSIAFFVQAGLDHVSCSPFRIPLARLAAAQARLRKESGEGEEGRED